MAGKLQLEQLMSTLNEEGGEVPDVVTIICGSRKFQILERSIRSRGQSLLFSLLEDPSRKDKKAPIYVEGDGERFRYILDWYRFGSLKVPSGMSVEEMRRECAFYDLPQDVQIEREAVGDAIRSLVSCRKKARKECTSAAAVAAAHAAFDLLLHGDGLTKIGVSTMSWSTSRPSDWKNSMVWSVVIDPTWTGQDSLRVSEFAVFKATLMSLAQGAGLAVKISETCNSSSYPGKVNKVEIQLAIKEGPVKEQPSGLC